MKNVLIAAAVLAAAAGAANADYVFNLGSGQFLGGQSVSGSANLSGICTGVSISFDFDPQASAGSWASDGGLFVIPPSGGANGSQWGGYDILIGGAAGFEGYWAYDGAGSAAAGPYADTKPSANPNLNGAGVWTAGFGNAWSTSGAVAYNNIVVTLHGVNVPTPGAAALLGLGGLAMARRRR